MSETPIYQLYTQGKPSPEPHLHNEDVNISWNRTGVDPLHPLILKCMTRRNRSPKPRRAVRCFWLCSCGILGFRVFCNQWLKACVVLEQQSTLSTLLTQDPHTVTARRDKSPKPSANLFELRVGVHVYSFLRGVEGFLDKGFSLYCFPVFGV